MLKVTCQMSYQSMDQVLERLFESAPKVRILRIFMRNSGDSFTLEDIAKRTQIRIVVAKKEVEKLFKLGVIEKKPAKVSEEVRRLISIPRKLRKKGGPKTRVKIRTVVRAIAVYSANTRFYLFHELQNLVSRSSVASKRDIANKIKNLGNIKLALISGVFTNNDRARTDMLIVGDKIKSKKIDDFLTQMESELGKSIHYTLMDTGEFKYRMNMYDRFLRDILEFPHEKLINKVHV